MDRFHVYLPGSNFKSLDPSETEVRKPKVSIYSGLNTTQSDRYWHPSAKLGVSLCYVQRSDKARGNGGPGDGAGLWGRHRRSEALRWVWTDAVVQKKHQLPNGSTSIRAHTATRSSASSGFNPCVTIPRSRVFLHSWSRGWRLGRGWSSGQDLATGKNPERCKKPPHTHPSSLAKTCPVSTAYIFYYECQRPKL